MRSWRVVHFAGLLALLCLLSTTDAAAGDRIQAMLQPQPVDVPFSTYLAIDTTTAPTHARKVLVASSSQPGVQLPAASVLLTASTTSSTPAVGDKVTVTLQVINEGNQNLTGIVSQLTTAGTAVTPSGGCTSSLQVGTNMSCTYQHTLTQDQIDDGSVGATATISAANVGLLETASTKVQIGRAVKMDLDASYQVNGAAGTTFTAIGDLVRYTLVFTNTGNVRSTFAVNASTTETSATTPVSCTPSSGTLITPNSRVTCNYTHTVNPTDIDNLGVTNNFVYTQTGAGDSGSKSSTVVFPTVTLQTLADFAVNVQIESVRTAAGVLRNDGKYRAEGDLIAYSITTNNTGNVILNITTAGTPACTSSSLRPGTSLTCSRNYTITQQDIEAGSTTVTAGVTAVPPSATGLDNQTKTSNTTVLADQGAAMGVAVAVVDVRTTLGGVRDGSIYSAAGDVLTYTITSTNSGNLNLRDLDITSNVGNATCLSVTVNPGRNYTCTGMYQFTQQDVENGAVNVTGIAKGLTALGNINATGTWSVTGNRTAAIAVAVRVLNVTNGDGSAERINNSYTAQGDVLWFEVAATNAGNLLLSNVNITNTLTPAQACTIGSLSPTNRDSCVISYTTTLSDLNKGSINISATATAWTEALGVARTDTQSVVVTAHQSPSLTVNLAVVNVTSTQSETVTAAGDIVTLRITTSNTGNVNISNVTASISRSLAACSPGELAPSTSPSSCERNYTVTQADIDNGNIVFTANATGASPLAVTVKAGPVNVTVPVNQTATIDVELSPVRVIDTNGQARSGGQFLAAGDIITYNITTTNTGNVVLSALNITGALFTTACSNSTLNLAPRDTYVCPRTYTVIQQDLNTGGVAVTATAQGSPPAGTSLLSPSKTVSTTVLANLTADLNVVMNIVNVTSSAASGRVLRAGSNFTSADDIVTYQMTATNMGNVDLLSVMINNTKLITPCSQARLSPKEQLNCTRTYSVLQSDLDAGSVAMLATASGTSARNTSNAVAANASLSVYGNQSPSLSVAVQIVNVTSGGSQLRTNKTFLAVGDTVTYTITLSNTGNVGLTEVNATDGISAPCNKAGTLNPDGTSHTCTYTYNITQADIDNGSKTIAAAGRGTSPLGVVVTATGNASVAGNQTASVGVRVELLSVAMANGTARTGQLFAAAGDVISYTVNVSNTGNVLLNSPTLTGTVPGTCTPAVPTSLSAGAVYSCTRTYAALQSDVDSGSLSLGMTVEATPAKGTVAKVNSTGSVNVTGTRTPDISVAVSVVSGDMYKAAGDAIVYTITMSNTGNVVLTNANATTNLLATCSNGTLNPGATFSCSNLRYNVTQDDINRGNTTVTATVVATPPSGIAAQPTGTASQTVLANQTASISVTLTNVTVMTAAGPRDNNTYAAAGDVVSYTITTTNVGNVLANNVRVTDSLVAAPSCPVSSTNLNPGQSFNCTRSYTITQADLERTPANVNISATARGTPPNGVDVLAAASQVVQGSKIPRLDLNFTAAPSTVQFTSDQVTFRLEGTNKGNQNLAGITINSTQLPSLGTSCELIQNPLPPSGTFVCSMTRNLTRSEISSGFVSGFTANVTASTATLNSGSVSTSVTVAIQRVASLSVDITNCTEISAPDDMVCDVTLANTGNLDFSNLAYVTDATRHNCPGTLEWGAGAQCKLTYTVSQAAFDSGDAAVVASVTVSDGVANVTATDALTQPLLLRPGLNITVGASQPALYIAGTLSYESTITNSGNTALLVDSKVDVTGGAGAQDLRCTPSGQMQRLDVGGQIQCTYKHTVARDRFASDIVAGVMANYTTVARAAAPLNGSFVENATTNAEVCWPGYHTICPRFIYSRAGLQSLLPSFKAECSDCTATVTFTSPFKTGASCSEPIGKIAVGVVGNKTLCNTASNVPAGGTVSLSGVKHGQVVIVYSQDSSYTSNAGFAADNAVAADFDRAQCGLTGRFCGRYGGYRVNCGPGC